MTALTARTRTQVPVLAALLALAFAMPVLAEEPAAAGGQAAGSQAEGGTLLHPKVDKPIPDTYEPLGGTRWEDRDEGTGEIRESWKLKQAEEERERRQRSAHAADSDRNAPPLQKDIRIQEILPEAPAASPPPKVEKDKDSLQIHDQ